MGWGGSWREQKKIFFVEVGSKNEAFKRFPINHSTADMEKDFSSQLHTCWAEVVTTSSVWMLVCDRSA